jgi:hypothetical protein
MSRSAILWVLAFFVTISSAIYQRMTGPTYPSTGKATVGTTGVAYRFLRSHDMDADAAVEVRVDKPGVTALLEWKRYKTDDAWIPVPMKDSVDAKDGTHAMSAFLPKQPAAGKLEYRVSLTAGNDHIVLPRDGNVVLRFKGVVPLGILIIHVFAMFSAMFLSTRTGLEFFNPDEKLRRLIPLTIGFLAVGGLILGPIVQKFAFDAYWTGWPFGHDLTDNKTILALLGWLAAYAALRRGKNGRVWALGAAILMFVVYMIPHSVLGSELDYKSLDNQSHTVQPGNR